MATPLQSIQSRTRDAFWYVEEDAAVVAHFPCFPFKDGVQYSATSGVPYNPTTILVGSPYMDGTDGEVISALALTIQVASSSPFVSSL